MLYKRGILIRTIALVLACAMPLCCCVLNAVTGELNSGCSEIETASCCLAVVSNHESPDQDKGEQESCDGYSCRIKGLVLDSNWTVPVDLIGSDIPLFLQEDNFCNATNGSIASIELPPPELVKITTLGNSSAPSMRGAVILEV